jgi:hypothetical protein
VPSGNTNVNERADPVIAVKDFQLIVSENSDDRAGNAVMGLNKICTRPKTVP